jgi:hypothetical protein
MTARRIVPLTADQVVGAYNTVKTQADMDAAHLVCDAAKEGFRDDDRSRVSGAMVAGVSRLMTWRPPTRCTECGHDTAYRRTVLNACGKEMDLSPLVGLRFKLERKTDRKQPCCNNIGIVRALNKIAEIRCADCGRPRGELCKKAVQWMLTVLAFWPAALKDVHVLRDHSPTLSPLTAWRRNAKAQREREEGTQGE